MNPYLIIGIIFIVIFVLTIIAGLCHMIYVSFKEKNWTTIGICLFFVSGIIGCIFMIIGLQHLKNNL